MPNNLIRASRQMPSSALDAGLQRYMLRVYNYMGAGLAVTGLIAWFAAASGLYANIVQTPLFWVIIFAPLALVMLLSFRIQKMSFYGAQITFWAYAALVGLSLAGIFLVYTRASIAETFFVAAVMFLGMSLYGYTTGRDLTGVGHFLFMGLIGIVAASLVNFFLASSELQIVISIVGIVVFVGLTAWDTQRIRELYLSDDDDMIAGKKAIMGALALYLDFLNLFLMLLQITGRRRR
jgi:FtsH-binding integral membrane protein